MNNKKNSKTKYYTLSNIEKQAQIFANKLSILRERHKNQVILPKNVALLVIDMQDFFYNPGYHAFVPSMLAITPRIKYLQEYCLEQTIPVFHTKHGNTPADGGQMLKWWDSINDKDSLLSNIIPEIQNPNAQLVEKTQYDAFWETGLEELLLSKNIEQIIITGVMAHLCCETTARAAFVRGFEVFFAIDGTATYNPEFHFGTLHNLAHGFARPVLINEIISEVKKHKGSDL